MRIGFLITLSKNDVDVLAGNIPSQRKQSFLLDLVDYYTSIGHEVFVITYSDQMPDQMIKNDNTTVYIVKRFNHGRLRAFLNFSHEITKVERILKKERYDVLHAQWCYEMASAALKIAPERTLITLHDWPDVVCPLIGNYYWKKRQRLGNSVLKRGINFTAVSPYIEETYKTKYGGRIVCIPNYISDGIILDSNVSKKDNEVKKIISINNGFDNRKNVKTLIEAWGEIRSEVKAELHLYGNGYEKDGLAYQWAIQNGVNLDGIEFHGCTDRKSVIAALRESDLLIHPSVEESFGMTLIEAMANKTVVIAGEKSGAVPWVLGYGKYGVLVDIMSKENIAQSAIALIKDSGRIKDLMAAGYDHILETYTLNRVAERYLDMYKAIKGELDESSIMV